METIVYKNDGKTTEPFDREKLEKTIFAACLNVREPQNSAKATSNKVAGLVEEWLTNKQEVTSVDIKEKVTELLAKYHPEASYIYEQFDLTI